MYDRMPVISARDLGGTCIAGYTAVRAEVERALEQSRQHVLILECYPGVNYQELRDYLIEPLHPDIVICSDELTIPAERIENMLRPNLTSDRVFGTMSYAKTQDYFDEKKLERARGVVSNHPEACVVVYGVGSSLVTRQGLIVYCDLCRWEIQLRYRAGMPNWLANNGSEDTLKKFKRGFFWEWRIADRLKDELYPEMDYVLDTNRKGEPRMITGVLFRKAMKYAAARPFRTVPYFDPGVWGGQWMKRVCGLDPAKKNYAWSFDGVPEENSLLFDFGGELFQTPCMNLIRLHPRELLGEKVFARFGAEFPIRFDFLDTMGGQNLSLQVHPLTAFIHEQFGMAYTQDESYYILDTGEGACIYLGLKEDVDREAMIRDLKRAQAGEISFPAHQYVNVFPAKKHDHFLIPAGTVHCSGANTMVLEISATPYIFTFKLWDWDRLGLDGLPRPTHIEFGEKNIVWERTTQWVREQLVNRVQQLYSDEHETEERTGLHDLEFIETRRNWSDTTVRHQTNGSVNVLNLVEGEEAVVESPTGAFQPFVVHYAETFIVPAAVTDYTVTPCGSSAGKRIATIKAYIRT